MQGEGSEDLEEPQSEAIASTNSGEFAKLVGASCNQAIPVMSQRVQSLEQNQDMLAK